MSPRFESQRTRSAGAPHITRAKWDNRTKLLHTAFLGQTAKIQLPPSQLDGFQASERQKGEGEEEKLHALHIPRFMSFPNAFSTAISSEGDRKHFRSECKTCASSKRGRRKTNTNVRAKIDCDKCISIKRDGITWHGKWIALEIQTARHSLLFGDRRYIKCSFNRSMFKMRLNFYGRLVWC